MNEDLSLDKRPSKYRQFIHELMFVFNSNLPRRLLPLCLAMVFVIGLVSIKENVIMFPSRLNDIGKDFLELSANVDLNYNLTVATDYILSSPFYFYEAMKDVTDLYSTKLLKTYLYIGKTLDPHSDSVLNKTVVILKDPPTHIIKAFELISLSEKSFIDGGVASVINLTSRFKNQ